MTVQQETTGRAAAKLTTLQDLKGCIVLTEPCEGWRIREDGLGAELGSRSIIPAGRHEARVRATIAQPGAGAQFSFELYVLAAADGVFAVKTIEAEFIPE